MYYSIIFHSKLTKCDLVSCNFWYVCNSSKCNVRELSKFLTKYYPWGGMIDFFLIWMALLLLTWLLYYITMICWSRDVLRRQTHNFYYVANRDMKINTGNNDATFEPLFTVVNIDTQFFHYFPAIFFKRTFLRRTAVQSYDKFWPSTNLQLIAMQYCI
jgi:hypothetical protein